MIGATGSLVLVVDAPIDGPAEAYGNLKMTDCQKIILPLTKPSSIRMFDTNFTTLNTFIMLQVKASVSKLNSQKEFLQNQLEFHGVKMYYQLLTKNIVNEPFQP